MQPGEELLCGDTGFDLIINIIFDLKNLQFQVKQSSKELLCGDTSFDLICIILG